jgi:hypothetical protein
MTNSIPKHVLLVADWAVDPHAVLAEASRRSSSHPRATFGVLVPAWLHGLDWAGDPRASIPCARRQVDAICDLAGAAGVHVEAAGVGDPDPVTAISDAVHDWPADEVLLFARPPRLFARGPLDLQHRAQRLIGRPVRRIAAPRAGAGSAHCDARSSTIAIPCPTPMHIVARP